MVEIKRVSQSTPSSLEPETSLKEPEDKYRLVYSKSKVYVNPTAYARDNIPGFVSLVKRVGQSAHTQLDPHPDTRIGSCKSYLSACMDPRIIVEREGRFRMG